ncbi:MAG TPA: hypothetical protein VF651_10905 [Gammaproteobacteria bacterium]
MRRILILTTLCLLGLGLAAGCASNPPDPRVPASTMHGCVVEMPEYPPCEPSPLIVPQPYYPTYVGPWYPGTGVVLVPYPYPVPVPVPATPPPRPRPPPPPPPRQPRHPRPVPCKPAPNRPCP